MKRWITLLLSVVLAFGLTVPINAAGTMEDDITVDSTTCNKAEGIDLYSITSSYRNVDGTISMPSDYSMVLKSESGSLTGATAQLKSAQGKADIKITVKSSTANELSLAINFANNKVETTLNNDVMEIVGSNGDVLKEIQFGYNTQAPQDEHNGSFNTLSQWNGTLGYMSGVRCKYRGTINVYESSQTLSYTYKSKGTQGIKAFRLDPTSNYTFSNGKYEYTSVNTKAGASNTVKLKLKTAHRNAIKSVLLQRLRYDGKVNTYGMVMGDLYVEYKDGCYVGGGTDPIYLGYSVTLKPQKVQSFKVSSRATTSIKLKWKKMTSVSKYQVYRSTKKNSGYKKIATVASSKTSYKDTKRKASTRYYYKVRSYKKITYKKIGTNKNTTTTTYSSYTSPLAASTRPVKATVTVRKSGRKLKITNKAQKATGFEFKLKQGKNGKYSVVKKYTGSKKRTFTTKKLEKGKTYYVKIRAYKQVSGKKYYGSYSNVKKIKI